MTIRSTFTILAVALPLAAMGSTLSSVEEREALRLADTQYDSAIERCGALPAEQQPACVEDAKASREKARTLAKGTQDRSEAKREARNEQVVAEFDAARAKCDALQGEEKKACIDAAKAAANEGIAQGWDEAGKAKIEATQRIEKSGCDPLTGREKAACLEEARVKYGK